MSDYLFLLPLSLVLGLIGLATFLWTLKRNQYDDLEGARYRILDEDDFPLPYKPDKTGLSVDHGNSNKHTTEEKTQ